MRQFYDDEAACAVLRANLNRLRAYDGLTNIGDSAMNEISPSLKAAISEVEHLAETLSQGDQDRVAEGIRKTLVQSLSPEAVVALLQPAYAHIAAGRVATWDDIKARINTKLGNGRPI